MKLTIVGAGAIGGIVGAHLQRSGNEVTLIERNVEHVRAVRERGVKVGGATDLTIEIPILTPQETPSALEVVLLAVKSQHTEDALGVIAPRLSADGYVVSLQNGLEEYKIAAAVGESRTVGGFLTFGGYYLRPGEIVYGGPGSFRVGELDGRVTRRVQELKNAFGTFHPVEVTGNIFGFLWGKEALGAFYFASALVDEDVSVLIDHEQYRPALSRLVGEVVSVARSSGVRCESIDGFDPNLLAEHPDEPDLTEPSWTAQRRYWGAHVQGRTGIWRDLAVQHRSTEADHLLAPVIARGEAAGIAVPGLTMLLGLVHQIERGERALSWANLDMLSMVYR